MKKPTSAMLLMLTVGVLSLSACSKHTAEPGDTKPVASDAGAPAASATATGGNATAPTADTAGTSTSGAADSPIHGAPGQDKSTPNATGGTSEATGDNVSTGNANGVPNAGAANAASGSAPAPK